jgi:hypothetical protein
LELHSVSKLLLFSEAQGCFTVNPQELAKRDLNSMIDSSMSFQNAPNIVQTSASSVENLLRCIAYFLKHFLADSSIISNRKTIYTQFLSASHPVELA